jgi:uncharacterized membrane protein
MTPFVIFLVLASTFMHAGWNLLARRNRTEVVFLRRVLITIAVVGFAPAVVSEIMAQSLSTTAWMCVVGSGFCFGFYFYALAHAYESSDLTAVYPVTRALPVLLVALADVLRGHFPTTVGWGAMALVVAGCFFAPLHSFREINVGKYVRRGTVWMLLAAAATIGFTVLDKMASEAVVTKGPGTAARYGYMLYLVACLTYLAFYRQLRARTDDHETVSWRAAFGGACLTFSGYWMILWAFQRTERASYVFAFRQFSIVIAVVLAFIFYRESGKGVRLTATALITIGLLAIALWGK